MFIGWKMLLSDGRFMRQLFSCMSPLVLVPVRLFDPCFPYVSSSYCWSINLLYLGGQGVPASETNQFCDSFDEIEICIVAHLHM